MGYATLGQLAGFLYDDETAVGRLPQDAGRLLKRADELLQDYTQVAVYATDSNDQPTDARVQAAFRKAACAQVEYWLAGDEEDDVLGPTAGLSVGGQTQTFGDASNRTTPMYLAPRAARALRAQGLLDSGTYST